MENEIIRPAPDDEGLQPVPLSVPRRILAWALAPLMLAVIALCIALIVTTVAEGDWADLGRGLAFPFFLVVSGSGLARRVLRAAMTGYYPGSLDRARADAERRAMLAALHPAGDEPPELPRRMHG